MICDVYMDEIDFLRDRVYHAEMKDKEEVRTFVRDLKKLVYDYKMVGMLYDFYTENVEYHKQNRISFSGVEDLVNQVLEFTVAFPDLKADVENLIVYKVDDSFYKVFCRLRYRGTNTGFSRFGAPTGKSLGDGCLNLSLFHLKKIGGSWKIDFEVNSDSEALIRETLTA